MNAEVKKLWVDAVRSEEYKQGSGYLKYQDRYCCLGVLCDIFHKETGKGKWIQPQLNTHAVFLNRTGMLPIEVQEWADLDTDSPETKDGTSLIYYNDHRSSFQNIATIIEEEL